jgi:glycosyltransferase involved in cell wall biosynthesis
MAQKLTIGLIFSNNENWIGGTYYILNLVQAFHSLPFEEQPNLVVFIDKPEDAKLIQATRYPNLAFYPLHFQYNNLINFINRVSSRFFRKIIFQKKYPKNIADIVFPYDLQSSLSNIKHKFCWIPDFQEHYLKDFFSEQVLAFRKKSQETIIAENFPIVFSSQDAQKSFQEIYPKALNKTHVINFAATHPAYADLNIEQLRKKYGISKPYVISPNQFWKHKNHQVILETALAFAQKQSFDIQFIFTGKEYDFRYPDYAESLKKFVQAHNLQEHVKFLGFIDRADQLQLMNHALAVVQPSLFEGWSTVVEDAKAMSQFLIVSDISVHQEQLIDYPNKLFFNPKEVESLSETLEIFLQQKTEKKNYNYKKNIDKFAQEFLNLFIS